MLLIMLLIQMSDTKLAKCKVKVKQRILCRALSLCKSNEVCPLNIRAVLTFQRPSQEQVSQQDGWQGFCRHQQRAAVSVSMRKWRQYYEQVIQLHPVVKKILLLFWNLDRYNKAQSTYCAAQAWKLVFCKFFIKNLYEKRMTLYKANRRCHAWLKCAITARSV